MRRVEHVLVGLDGRVAGALLRVGLGYLTAVAWLQLIAVGAPGWVVMPFFLVVLATVRVVPAVIRVAGRFGEPVRQVWTGRRQLAKRYDSYQWQKLFWIGLGLMLHVPLSERRSGALLALAAACLLAGTMGLAAWRSIGREGNDGGSDAVSGKGAAPDALTIGSRA